MSTDVKAIKDTVSKHFATKSNLTFEANNTKDGANGIHYTYMESGKKYHIKVVDKSKCDKNGWSEIELLKDIDSPNVIKLIEHGDLDRDNYYLVFEHIDGDTLEKIGTDFWTKDEAKKLLLDMATALDSLKVQKLVHRDIKSKNIIYDKHNDKYVLLDLGIGYFINKPQKSNTPISKTSGAKYFSSPEQMWISAGKSIFDICWSSDQFSLGVVAYYAFSGQHPFSGTAKPEINNYTELVTGDRTFLKHLSELRPDLGEEICGAVMKMLEVNPCKRFQSLAALRSAIDGVEYEDASRTKMMLKMPSEAKEDFCKYIKDTTALNDFGVLITSADALKNAATFEENNIEILFDPQTHKLQLNKSHALVEDKLNLPSSKENDFLWDERRLSDHRDDILHGVIQVNKKLNTSRVILPYYVVDNPESAYLGITKDIWRNAKTTVTSSMGADTQVFGALVLPKNMVANQERTIIMDSLLSDYHLDGIYVIFENDDEKIRTTTDAKYLSGVKEYIEFFKSTFGKVIVGMSDISTICMLEGSDYIVTWAKSSRHFNLHPPVRQSKKGEPKPPRKMQYFAPGLFTMVEEKTTVAQIIKAMGNDDVLSCSCSYCETSKPLSSGYKEQRATEEYHFYENMGLIQRSFKLKSDGTSSRDAIKKVIETCDSNCSDVRKASSLTTEIIPDLKSIISVIEN